MQINDERFERITAGAPKPTDSFARAILRDQYGVQAVSCRPLAGETDHNTHVVDGTGAQYILKVSSSQDRRAIEFQSALLRQLAEREPGLQVPRVVENRSGALVTTVHDGDQDLVVRMLTWVSGMPLAEVRRRSAELLTDIGTTAGRLAVATAAFEHPSPPSPHYWHFAHAGTALAGSIPRIEDPDLRAAVERLRERHLPMLEEGLPRLPTAVVHHDLNVFNMLVRRNDDGHRVSGVIDFGDALPAPRVADLAVLASSAMRGSPRPLTVAATLAAAYHKACPLEEAELDLLFPLIAIRSATVVATTARLTAEQRHGDPRHRSRAAIELAVALADLPAVLGTAVIRQACGLDPHPPATSVTRWFGADTASMAPLVAEQLVPVDLSASGALFDGIDPSDSEALRTAARTGILGHDTATPVGRYGEPRFLTPCRRRTGEHEPDNVHLGIDVFAAAGTAVHAPLAGVVEDTGIAGVDLVLRHEPAEGVDFRTLYTGLSVEVSAGERVAPHGLLGHVAADTDDRLPPRVRVQIATVPLGEWSAVPIAVTHSDRGVWEALFPDPTPLLGAQRTVAPWTPVIHRAVQGRRAHLPSTHPTYFSTPIAMVSGRDCRLYDEQGRSYLDALNNVTLVGHGHPRLVKAASRQLGRLNTNSRFVYDVLTEYAERLTATLPDGLDVVYFVNSGSEANDLALRMARYLTGRDDVVVIDDAYHGYTSAVADVSPSRYRHYGKPDTTHPTPVPDRYRGPYGYDDPEAGARYARQVIGTFDRLAGEGRMPAAYLFEALLAGAGQIVLPPGYLAPIFAAAAERGIFTIADEVQVGFGRLGEAFWGFQTQGPEIVPDFVTMGKAMGNGFPMAALVTRRDISQAFDATGRFFSTYGGNPVACAIGLELLDILEEEQLQHNALSVGQYLRDQLAELAGRHELIGDVRGQGFYSGVEFVRDRHTREPAREETLIVCERLKDEGVLVYPTGPFWNVLKLKPPLMFSRAHADEFTATLDEILEAGW
jgi:4-aminobutyrate aminotransferase-like enzyme/Ser/Thr protein kinase RdoA (MazF antagonist)